MFQDIGAVRVDLIHRADGDIVGLAGLLLHPTLQIHPRQGQTLRQYFYTTTQTVEETFMSQNAFIHIESQVGT